MCFTAYFDETGTDDRSAVVGVAGYLAPPSMWEAFEARWRAALREFGITGTRWPYWRQSSFAHSSRQFQGWGTDEPLRQQRLAHMLQLINDHVLFACGAFMRKGDYYAHVSPEANAFVGGPYGLAASAMMLYVADALDQIGAVGKVAYVFEAGAEGAGEVARVFSENLRSPGNRDRHHLLSIRFEDKRDFVQLQAADVLAYELRREYARQSQIEDRPTRFPILELVKTPNNWGYMGPDQMKLWSRIITIRSRLRPDQLEWLPAQPAVEGCKAISAREFRERCRWMRFFMKEEHLRTGRAE